MKNSDASGDGAADPHDAVAIMASRLEKLASGLLQIESLMSDRIAELTR
jgi:hypothetical protein